MCRFFLPGPYTKNDRRAKAECESLYPVLLLLLLLLLYRTYKALFSYIIKDCSKALYTMNSIIIDTKNKE